MKHAEGRVCDCKTKSHIVFLGVVDIKPHELESLGEFYCTQCNAFWREP